jgi:hypothetical protein
MATNDNVLDFVKAGRAAGILDDRDFLVTRKEAAVYLRKSIPTLERWARDGVGPRPVKIQRTVHYRLSDLRAAAQGGDR